MPYFLSLIITDENFGITDNPRAYTVNRPPSFDLARSQVGSVRRSHVTPRSNHGIEVPYTTV